MRFTLAQLADLIGAKWIGNPSFVITGINTLEEASQEDASFLANPRYSEQMKTSKAGVICVSNDVALQEGKNYLLCQDPSAAIQTIAEQFIPKSTSAFIGIHPTAVIHESAHVDETATIGPYAVIDQGTSIGSRSVIGPHVSIGSDVTIGEDCFIHPHVTIRERTQIGNRVILQPGAVIGSCGFGYRMDAHGRHIKLEQLGHVILEDDVEIGANTTIDRARFKVTRISQGSKIDNLVQIGHNAEVGKHNVIAAQTGIAGSSKTGKYVMLGGQVGIVGHVELADQVMIATRGGVSKSLKTGKYRGSPAIDFDKYQRQEVHVRKLEEYARRLKELEKKFLE